MLFKVKRDCVVFMVWLLVGIDIGCG